MIKEIRERESHFYKILDTLMLSTYEDCEIIDGQYVLRSKHLKIDVRPRAFYFHLNPTKYVDPIKFKENSVWSNKIMKCGFKLTASTGNTYSYPGLRDYIKNENENDKILRASYYFSCIVQIISFFSQQLGDIGFERSVLINGDD